MKALQWMKESWETCFSRLFSLYAPFSFKRNILWVSRELFYSLVIQKSQEFLHLLDCFLWMCDGDQNDKGNTVMEGGRNVNRFEIAVNIALSCCSKLPYHQHVWRDLLDETSFGSSISQPDANRSHLDKIKPPHWYSPWQILKGMSFKAGGLQWRWGDAEWWVDFGLWSLLPT